MSAPVRYAASANPFLPAASVHHGTCLDVLRGLPDGSMSSVITDPPYGLSDHSPAEVTQALMSWATGDREHVPDGKGFMGSEWDRFVPPPAVWDECLRVLKPGGYMAVFAGSRTADLMGLSVRLAGFEMRDTITWCYGNGFPKSKNALKPASEPIIVARKPFKGSELACIAANGTGGMNIDACRVPSTESTRRTNTAELGYHGKNLAAIYQTGSDNGRWPANLVLSHSEYCGVRCAEGCPVAELDRQSGSTKSSDKPRNNTAAAHNNTPSMGKSSGDWTTTGFNDSGGASRFFPTFRYQAKAPKSERPTVNGVAHPTVKPLALMEWLVTLLTPPYGTVLDPFGGTGTTGHAALRLGFSSTIIERDPQYWPLIDARLNSFLEVSA